MKKVASIAAALLLFCLPRLALPDSVSFLTLIGTGATASPACASGSCNGTADSTSGSVDISKASYARVQIWCISGPCTGTITINQSSKRSSTTQASPPLVATFTCADVTTAGVCSGGAIGYINLSITGYMNAVQSGTAAGTFGVILETHLVSP